MWAIEQNTLNENADDVRVKRERRLKKPRTYKQPNAPRTNSLLAKLDRFVREKTFSVLEMNETTLR